MHKQCQNCPYRNPMACCHSVLKLHASLPKKVKLSKDEFAELFEKKQGVRSAWRELVKDGLVADV